MKNFKSIKNKLNFKEYLSIIAGTFIMAVAIVIFIAPLKLAPGGVYGIAIILHHLFNFPIGISGIAMDIPLLILGTLILGPKFGFKTIIGIISLSGFITLLELMYGYDPLISLVVNGNIIPDPAANLIIALFGGLLTGLGLGLVFKARATSGGTDIVAMAFKKYFKHIPLGTMIIMVDSVIVIAALAIFRDWSIPLYSWVVIYVTGYTVDTVISGFARRKAVLIISDEYDEIKKFIINELGRGGTYLHGEGMYNAAEKKIIFTTMSSKELPSLLFHIHETDPKAFVSILDATDVFGEGFNSLREKALH